MRILVGPEERVVAESASPAGIFRHSAEVATFPIQPEYVLRDDVKVESRGDQFIALKESGPWGPEGPVLTLIEQASRYLRFAALPAVAALPEMQ